MKFVITILPILFLASSFNVSILFDIKSGDVATASLTKKSSIGNSKMLSLSYWLSDLYNILASYKVFVTTNIFFLLAPKRFQT